MTPAEIAAKLTPAQKRALLWLPADGSGRNNRGAGRPRADIQWRLKFHRAGQMIEQKFIAYCGDVVRLTPLGLAVRAIIEQKPALATAREVQERRRDALAQMEDGK
jgi:hypothetical protein